MFREMRRFKQQVSDEECIRVLKEQPRGVLSMIGDDGYPYGIPLDHWYCEENGRLYFHGAKEGHKIDAITKCDKVSYCVMDEGFRKEGEWALNITSVVVFGRIRFVTDQELKYIKHEVEFALPRAQCLELIPEHMTGKLVNES